MVRYTAAWIMASPVSGSRSQTHVSPRERDSREGSPTVQRRGIAWKPCVSPPGRTARGAGRGA
jgi:hypothetical protein